MPNKHITQFLDYYIDLSNPQYAVLLKGKWGSGKTHFINEYKETMKNQNKKYIYVSLYGVKSYDEIETKFLQATNPSMFNDKTIFTGKIANAFFNDKVKGSLKEIKKSLSSLNSINRILIFDDLERCSINIVDLLGYINYFVEHQSYNVILIANEEKFDEEKKYKEIKEKLIGKIFELKPNSTLAYDSFFAELKKDKNIFIEYKNEILKIFEQSECNNLRILRQSILDFQRLYSKALNIHIKNSELIKDFIKIYLIIYIEMKKGEYNVLEEYAKDRDIYNDVETAKRVKNNLKVDENPIEDNKNLVNFKEFIRKYKIDNYSFNLILDIKLWKDIINDSFIDSKKLIKY